MESYLHVPDFLNEGSFFMVESNESLNTTDTKKYEECTVPYPSSGDSLVGSFSSPSVTSSLVPSTLSGSTNLSSCDLSDNAYSNYNCNPNVSNSERSGIVIKQIPQSSDNQTVSSIPFGSSTERNDPSANNKDHKPLTFQGPAYYNSKRIESSSKSQYRSKAVSNRPVQSRRRSFQSSLTEEEEKVLRRLKKPYITIIDPIDPEERSKIVIDFSTDNTPNYIVSPVVTKSSDGLENRYKSSTMKEFWISFIYTRYDERTTHSCSFLSRLFVSLPNEVR